MRDSPDPTLAASEPAIQDEVAHSLRMPDRIGDGDGATLRDPQQRKPLQAIGVNDALEITHERLEGNILHVPVGETISPLVVADQPVSRGDRLKHVAPDRTLPVIFQMVEPVRGLHQRWPLADRGVGDSHPVGRGTELNLLPQSPGSRPGAVRRSLRQGLFAFFDLADEAKPFTGNRLDQGLDGTGVADGSPGRNSRRSTSSEYPPN